jgi:hypothetical protein
MDNKNESKREEKSNKQLNFSSIKIPLFARGLNGNEMRIGGNQ